MDNTLFDQTVRLVPSSQPRLNFIAIEAELFPWVSYIQCASLGSPSFIKYHEIKAIELARQSTVLKLKLNFYSFDFRKLGESRETHCNTIKHFSTSFLYSFIHSFAITMEIGIKPYIRHKLEIIGTQTRPNLKSLVFREFS